MTVPNVSKMLDLATSMSRMTLDLGQFSKRINIKVEDLEQFKTAGKKIASLEKEFTSYKKFLEKQGLDKLGKQFKEEVKKRDLQTKGLKKGIDEGKKIVDTILKKVPGGSTAAKAVGASNMLGVLAIIGAQAGIAAFAAWVSNFVQDTQDKYLEQLSADLTKANGRALANTALIRKQQERINEINKKVADTTDKIYAEAGGAVYNATLAREKANEALYETRAGRTKLEAEIAAANKKSNDALYETRAGRTKLENKIAQVQSQINKFSQGATSNFQSRIESTIKNIQNQLTISENKIVNLEKTKPTLQDKLLQTVQDSVKKISGDLGSVVTRLSQIEKQVKTVEVEHPKRWTTSINQTDAATRAYVDKKLVQSNQPSSLFNVNTWINKYGDSLVYLLNNKIPSLDKTDSALSGGIATLKADTDKRLAQVEKPSTVGDTGVSRVELQLKDVKTELDKLKVSDTKINTDLKDLTGKIKEQEKVNKDAIPKLDQILGILPFIPARTADVIRPSIPTVPQIENAAKTGTCQTFQPGGCGANALNGLGNSINQNTNNQSNNLFDKINAGANAAQLALLTVINNKLGAQIAGGISGKLVAGFKWLQLDRALNVLTFAATVQNHVMLSNNIAETLFAALNNGLKIIGFKNDNGEPFTLSSSIEALVKGIVGAEDYAVISEAWAKANRIYQASSNVLNSFLNLSQTILQASELIAAYTGRIGNALRKGGVILENAYGWMNPQPKFNRTTQLLENLQNGASMIQMVTQAPLDIVNATTEFTTASTEFVKAVKEDDKPENKATPTPEPDELKAKETNSKAASQPLNFNFSDLFDGED